MLIYRELNIGSTANKKIIYFGQADKDEELLGIYKLRYDVYSSKKYIDPTKYLDGIERDNYDLSGKSIYFFSKLNNKIIGTIRVIIDKPLPTEKYFSFIEPKQLASISRDQRCELGRFIIIPPNRENGDYLPRGLIMLFLFDAIVEYCSKNNIQGGYSFVKKSLEIKMKKLKMPIVNILKYTQKYPADGVLYNYFTQPNDPVIPIYFLTNSFMKYIKNHLNNNWIFDYSDGNKYSLKENAYTLFLKKLNII